MHRRAWSLVVVSGREEVPSWSTGGVDRRGTSCWLCHDDVGASAFDDDHHFEANADRRAHHASEPSALPLHTGQFGVGDWVLNH